jgi:hypothetical protein
MLPVLLVSLGVADGRYHSLPQGGGLRSASTIYPLQERLAIFSFKAVDVVDEG